jgi:hypothetical protein
MNRQRTTKEKHYGRQIQDDEGEQIATLSCLEQALKDGRTLEQVIAAMRLPAIPAFEVVEEAAA